MWEQQVRLIMNLATAESFGNEPEHRSQTPRPQLTSQKKGKRSDQTTPDPRNQVPVALGLRVGPPTGDATTRAPVRERHADTGRQFTPWESAWDRSRATRPSRLLFWEARTVLAGTGRIRSTCGTANGRHNHAGSCLGETEHWGSQLGLHRVNLSRQQAARVAASSLPGGPPHQATQHQGNTIGGSEHGTALDLAASNNGK
ncbi:hypothetical protein NDU88_005660 [Pleurodeles waltl]|uniref:Uncharacterized protein n=1 Tax=Pleurodeles waltl TaxID=8319 RepID=A0AAV7TC86_PLEWA|nr:hypothetical protein NDU88_005660 [Pleurodeles waltl]